MTINDLKLNQFGITLDNKGESPILDSNLYQDLFDYFNDLDGLTLDEESVEVTEDINKVTFTSDDLLVHLNADFNKDEYTIIVEEVK